MGCFTFWIVAETCTAGRLFVEPALSDSEWVGRPRPTSWTTEGTETTEKTINQEATDYRLLATDYCFLDWELRTVNRELLPNHG